MEFLLLAPFVLVAAALFAVTLAATLRHYRALPAQVPDHFDEYGRPDQFGPRPMIFGMTFAQAFVIAIWLVVIAHLLDDPHVARAIVVSGIAADSALAAFAWLQQQMLGVAQGLSERMPHQYRPLALLLAGVAAAVVAAVLLR